jgi:hypothetical protein
MGTNVVKKSEMKDRTMKKQICKDDIQCHVMTSPTSKCYEFNVNIIKNLHMVKLEVGSIKKSLIFIAGDCASFNSFTYQSIHH